MMPTAPQATPLWRLCVEGVTPRQEPGIEARLAIGNGLLGVRGARAASRSASWPAWQSGGSWVSWPRTYLAGLFDTPNTTPAVPALAPLPDWLRLVIRLDGVPLLLEDGETLLHHRTLDLQRGWLTAEWRQRSAAGITARLRTRRLVSQADRVLGLQLAELTIDRDNVEVELEARVDLAACGLEIETLEADAVLLRTLATGRRVALAASATCDIGAPLAAPPLAWRWSWRSRAGAPARLTRLVAVVRDAAETGLAHAALRRGEKRGPELLAEHEAAWATRWEGADVALSGDDPLQLALRFAIHHLIASANPGDEHVSIGARGLTGDGYLGHVFWDTETYLLPFFTFAWPEAARALLMYRFRTLDGARAKAAHEGWKGACFAWESADTGEETTPEEVIGPAGTPVEVLTGKQEQHITADVALAVWQYWQATGDEDFLLDAGAEILLETARFWASRALPEADGRRHIRGVIGPDEYHETIDDNAFTNQLARWNIRRGLEVLELLAARWPERAAELREGLAIAEDEPAAWREAADALVDGLDPASGLVEQFAGFHALEEIDLASLPPGPADVVLGRARTQGAQVVKQADVVALLGLLPEAFSREAALLNFRHYEPRCAHGSSLSRAMHALVAARLGEDAMALRYLAATAELELADDASGEAGGVHIAALGGLWQAVVLGFGGVEIAAGELSLAPRLPAGWGSLAFPLHWHGRRLRVALTPGSCAVTLERGAAMTLRLAGTERVLAPGETVTEKG